VVDGTITRPVALALLAVLGVGELYAVVTRDETRWPYSCVPMFSGLKYKAEVRMLAPVAVTLEGEVNLVDAGVFDYKVQRVLMAGYDNLVREEGLDPADEKAYRLAIRDAVVSQSERAGLQGVQAVRVYAYTWNIEAIRAQHDGARTDELVFEEAVE
jgi:hypothetical protein